MKLAVFALLYGAQALRLQKLDTIDTKIDRDDTRGVDGLHTNKDGQKVDDDGNVVNQDNIAAQLSRDSYDINYESQ